MKLNSSQAALAESFTLQVLINIISVMSKRGTLKSTSYAYYV